MLPPVKSLKLLLYFHGEIDAYGNQKTESPSFHKLLRVFSRKRYRYLRRVDEFVLQIAFMVTIFRIV